MLKNYTSTIAATKSIAYIESKLAQHKANMIVKIYDPQGKVEAIAFEVKVNEVPIAFRLPAQIQACERTLREGLSRKARPETVARLSEQAERTAWKIVADWVDAQMAMIDLAQVELVEVFLPYAFDRSRNQTFYGRIKERNFQALLPAGSSP